MVTVAAGRGITAISGLAIMALLTRHLGPEAFGEYRTILAYATYAYLTSDLGLYAYTLRAISEPGADKRLLIATAFRLRLLLAVMFLSVSFVIGLAIPFSPVVHIGIALAAFGYVCFGGSELLLAAFQSELRQYQYAATEVVGSLVNLLLAYLVVVYDLGVLAAVSALVSGFVVMLASNLALLWHTLSWGTRLDWLLVREMLKGSMPFAGALALGLVYSKLDIVFLSLLQSPSDVGIYGIIHKVSDVAMALPYFFAGLVMPSLTAAAMVNTGRFAHVLSRSYTAMCVGGVGTTLVILLFADEFIRILAGSEFAMGASALQIIGLKIGLFFVANLLIFATTALRRQQDMLKGHAFAAIISVVAYIMLIPSWSYNGAAISATVAEVVILFYALYLVRIRAGNVIAPSIFLKCVAAAVVTYWVMTRTPISEAHWFIQLVLVGLLYMALAGFFRTGAWTAFREVVRR
jgi:O-antigen/teichoic acid export membrane protein